MADTGFLRIVAPDEIQHVYVQGSAVVLLMLEYLLVQAGAVPDAGGYYTLPPALADAAAQYWAASLDELAHLRAAP